MTFRRFFAAIAAVMLALWAFLFFYTRNPILSFLAICVLGLGGALFIAIGVFLFELVRDLVEPPRQEKLVAWERSGEAERIIYQVARCASFEDFNTSCLVHLLEVGQCELLVLYGQSYYDYEPIDDDPEFNQRRRFPTRTFEVLRKTDSGELLEIYPGQALLEQEVQLQLSALSPLYDLGLKLEDGELRDGLPFERVQEALAACT